mgnify:CR=1 FL=1
MENNEYKVSYWVPGALKNAKENLIFKDINQRLTLIEEKVFKKVKRIRGTEAQRFLIHYHLDLIKPIQEMGILSQNQKALLLSVMIDCDKDNAEKFLAELGKKERPKLHTETNYRFLVEVFETLGMEEKAKEADRILNEILNRKGK